MLILKFIWFSIFAYRINSEEIMIRDVSSISYLEKSMRENLKLFPEDLKFGVHLTRIPGLLFYSIDKNLNQLIVKVHDEFDPFLTVEFNKKKYLIAIRKLCRCDRCIYETLKFRFWIKEGIQIQCNDGDVISYKYSPNQQFKSKYPIPNFQKDNCSAYLWMVNIPEFEQMGSKFYPENEFITGCIFDISHNSKSIPMDLYGHGISKQCIKQCRNGICNGGNCLETFDFKPVCDCYKTYKNGDYCNSTLIITDMHNDGFQFEVLKISWRSSLRDILLLTNKFVELAVKVEENELYFLFQNTNQHTHRFQRILLENYLFNLEYTLIFTVEYDFIDIQIGLHSKPSWTNVQIHLNRTLNKEVFDRVIFLNNSVNEVGELVFKVSKKETKWRHIGTYVRHENNAESNYKFYSKLIHKIRTAGSSERNIFNEHPLLYFFIGGGVGIAFTIIIIIVVIYTCPSCIPLSIRKKIKIQTNDNELEGKNTEILTTSSNHLRNSSDILSKSNDPRRRSTGILLKNNSLRSSNDVLVRNNSSLTGSQYVLVRRSYDVLSSSNYTLHPSIANESHKRWSRIDI